MPDHSRAAYLIYLNYDVVGQNSGVKISESILIDNAQTEAEASYKCNNYIQNTSRTRDGAIYSYIYINNQPHWWI